MCVIQAVDAERSINEVLPRYRPLCCNLIQRKSSVVICAAVIMSQAQKDLTENVIDCALLLQDSCATDFLRNMSWSGHSYDGNKKTYE